jgi:hypothetical protein
MMEREKGQVGGGRASTYSRRRGRASTAVLAKAGPVTAVTLWDLSTTTFAVTGSVAGERVDVDENQVDGML